MSRFISFLFGKKKSKPVPPSQSPPPTVYPKEEDFYHRYGLHNHNGKFSMVHHLVTNQSVLMKIISKERTIIENRVEKVVSELEVMKKLDSPFVARLLSGFQSANGLYLQMDVHEAQTFQEFIFFNGRLKNDHATFYMAELLLGVQYLHQRDIVHRNLSLDTLLIDEQGHLKIFDFGTAKARIAIRTRCYTLCSRPELLPPEAHLTGCYTRSIDWWGYGLVMLEMLGHPNIFDDVTVEKVKKRILATNKEDLQPFDNVSHVAHDLLSNLLTYDETRFSGVDILRHAFFEAIEWEKIESQSLEVPIDDFYVDDDTTLPLGKDLPPFEAIDGEDPFKAFWYLRE
uniref:Protein kinase domain-containing protein n=1 Tax=Caenorhabditis tropicalis TaxID=1561998 RepID=A0A1I7URN2_9PELO